MHAEELWTSAAFKARALRALLTPASWLYCAGWQGYLVMYRLGIKPAKRPHSPVICIGNLQVGGTGKTPVAVHVADLLAEGAQRPAPGARSPAPGTLHPVAISCSGYGSPASRDASVAPAGELKASEWGDEAALIRWLRPEIPLIVGRNRVRAASLGHSSFPGSILLMDDGFQHLPLYKDVAIVLDPPVENRRCLPAGPYREPWGNRRRADLVVPDRFRVEAEPLRLVASRRSAEFIPPFLRPTSVGPGEPTEEREADANGAGTAPAHMGGTPMPLTVLCALGRPQRFLDSLKGFEIGHVELRPDHDPLTEGNLLAGLPKGRPIVVTGKDWVKLRERPDVGSYEILVAEHSVRIEPEEEFRAWLRAKLDAIET